MLSRSPDLPVNLSRTHALTFAFRSQYIRSPRDISRERSNQRSGGAAHRATPDAPRQRPMGEVGRPVDPARRRRRRRLAVGRRASARSRSKSAAVTERAAGTQASVLNASGYVTARRRATVSSKVTGKVIEVNVDEGMAVRTGSGAGPPRRLDGARRARAGARAGRSRRSAPSREHEVRLAEAQRTLRAPRTAA